MFLTDDFSKGSLPKDFSDGEKTCVFSDLQLNLIQNNRKAEADYFGRLIVERDPKCADAWIYLGMSASIQGRHGEGIKLIAKGLEINDQSAVGWSQLGMAYLHNKQLVEAEKSYKKALEVESHPTIDSWDSMLALFAILIVTNRISQAKEFVRNISGFLLTEHPDVPAESGNRWIEFLESIIDNWEGNKASVEQTYHSDTGRRLLLGWSQEISEFGKSNNPFSEIVISVDKGVIERAKRLYEITERIFE